jgi:hypothetical protein
MLERLDAVGHVVLEPDLCRLPDLVDVPEPALELRELPPQTILDPSSGIALLTHLGQSDLQGLEMLVQDRSVLVELESRLNEGSTFTIIIPRYPTDGAPLGPDPDR